MRNLSISCAALAAILSGSMTAEAQAGIRHDLTATHVDSTFVIVDWTPPGGTAVEVAIWAEDEAEHDDDYDPPHVVVDAAARTATIGNMVPLTRYHLYGASFDAAENTTFWADNVLVTTAAANVDNGGHRCGKSATGKGLLLVSVLPVAMALLLRR